MSAPRMTDEDVLFAVRMIALPFVAAVAAVVIELLVRVCT